jgi:hypothetical protein
VVQVVLVAHLDIMVLMVLMVLMVAMVQLLVVLAVQQVIQYTIEVGLQWLLVVLVEHHIINFNIKLENQDAIKNNRTTSHDVSRSSQQSICQKSWYTNVSRN